MHFSHPWEHEIPFEGPIRVLSIREMETGRM